MEIVYKALLITLTFCISFCSLQKAPVWEITGAEFSKSTTHTAAGISIRFPRVTRIRDDKDWKTANDLPHLRVQYMYFTSIYSFGLVIQPLVFLSCCLYEPFYRFYSRTQELQPVSSHYIAVQTCNKHVTIFFRAFSDFEYR